MKRRSREFRLLPLVLLATVALLALKSFGLVFDGGYLLGPSATEEDARSVVGPGRIDGKIVGPIPELAAKPKLTMPEDPVVAARPVTGGGALPSPMSPKPWAQEMFDPDVTGSVPAKKKETNPAPEAKGAPAAKGAAPEKGAASKDGAAAPATDPGKTLGMPSTRPVSPSERAILERLQGRRKDLEARARELEMRETLLKATEKQLKSRAGDPGEEGGGAKAAEKKREDENARFKGLVSMYENMKAKDAARIFDRLDLKILAEIAGRINPRRMADILANMSPEAAERLTVEFASRGSAPKSPAVADLPKIEGRPNPRP
jgi:flagellar motility protein MotE (MotC chaperone)